MTALLGLVGSGDAESSCEWTPAGWRGEQNSSGGVGGRGSLVVYLGLPSLLPGMVSYCHVLEEAVPERRICVVVRSDRSGGGQWGWEGRVEAERRALKYVCLLGQ